LEGESNKCSDLSQQYNGLSQKFLDLQSELLKTKEQHKKELAPINQQQQTILQLQKQLEEERQKHRNEILTLRQQMQDQNENMSKILKQHSQQATLEQDKAELNNRMNTMQKGMDQLLQEKKTTLSYMSKTC